MQALAEILRKRGDNEPVSLRDLHQRQLELESEAADVLGFDFSECTYTLGPLRQTIYACRTCTSSEGGALNGVCAACSIACHTGTFAFSSIVLSL
jgi:E3 ubiquitin-protein ligase UBR7